jgi:hypothetical protein
MATGQSKKEDTNFKTKMQAEPLPILGSFSAGRL